MKIGSQNSAQYRRDIDGLRAVAVLAVIVNHAFPALLPGGYVGVDIFFVISGYLISGHIFEAMQSQSFSLLDFYVKRIRRIFPSLLTVLIACLVIGWFCLFSREYVELGQLTAAGASFLANIVLWKTTGYFDTGASYKILLHLWSLGIEEQYYIVWPAFLLVFHRRLRSIFPLILVITLLSFALNVIFLPIRTTATFFSPVTRFWELLVGVILAYVTLFGFPIAGKITANRFSAEKTRNAQSIAGALLIVYSVSCLSRVTEFPGWWALLPTIGTYLLIAAGPSAWINRMILSQRLPVWIGMISYPLYLWHWPLLVFSRLLSDGTPGVGLRALAILTAGILSWLTYRFIEVPLRFGYVSPRSRLVVAGMLSGLMLLTGLYGYAVGKNKIPLSSRFPGADDGTNLSTLQEVDRNCKRKYPFSTDFCQISNEQAPPTVALLGDSHAIHFYGAMKSYFDKRNENLLALGEGDCLPFYDVDVKVTNHQAKKCPALNDPALDQATSSSSIHTIILSAYSVFAITGTGFPSMDAAGERKTLQDLQNPSERSNTTIYREGLRRTVLRAMQAGKKVLFVLDNPELDFDPSSCIVHRPFNFKEKGIRQPCGLPSVVVRDRQSLSRKLIVDTLAEFPEVKILDPLAVLCPESICLAGKDGVSFYMDRNHLSPQGADYLVERFKW
jgi:peptidoglycan/LPS O-acetylase OafA/YrhL